MSLHLFAWQLMQKLSAVQLCIGTLALASLHWHPYCVNGLAPYTQIMLLELFVTKQISPKKIIMMTTEDIERIIYPDLCSLPDYKLPIG